MQSSVSEVSSELLTFEKWCEWRNTNLISFRNSRTHLTESEQREKDEKYLRSEYSWIALHPDLLKHFLNMTCSMQTEIVLDIDLRDYNIMRDRVNMSILIHQLRLKNPANATQWSTLNHVLNSYITEQAEYAESEEFRGLTDAFLDTQDSLKCKNLNYASVTLTMLRLLYSESRVSEVAEAWIVGSKTPDLLVLTKLVHQWDEFKTFPIQWSISILENELITNSGSSHREDG